MSHGLSDDAARRQITQMAEFIKLEARQKADEIRIKVRSAPPRPGAARSGWRRPRFSS